MRPTRFLIFDLDGTLIDSSEGVVEAVNYSLRQMSQPEQPPEVIKSYIGFPLSKMYPDFTEAPLEELYGHFRAKASETIVSSTTPLEGVQTALQQLKNDGLTMAIATTKIRENVDGILAKLGWQSLFDVTISGNEVPRVKPEPDAFHQALMDMGASPDESLAVGDTVNDVLAAQAVPMRVVAVESPYGSSVEMLSLRPDYFIRSVAELPGLLQDKANTGS